MFAHTHPGARPVHLVDLDWAPSRAEDLIRAAPRNAGTPLNEWTYHAPSRVVVPLHDFQRDVFRLETTTRWGVRYVREADTLLGGFAPRVHVPEVVPLGFGRRSPAFAGVYRRGTTGLYLGRGVVLTPRDESWLTSPVSVFVVASADEDPIILTRAAASLDGVAREWIAAIVRSYEREEEP